MKKYILYILILNSIYKNYSQQNLPVYTDYLSDNNYLVHPAVSGISTIDKIRFTVRQQWSGIAESPNLQTLSGFIHLNDENSLGMTLYNDQNGNYSRQSIKLGYTYKVNLGKNEQQKMAFSIGLSYLSNFLNTESFNLPDRIIGQTDLKQRQYNIDVGFAFRSKRFFSLYTIKDLAPVKNFFTDKTTNIRHHLVSIGYFIKGDEHKFKIQMSLLGQYLEQTDQNILDTNIKFFFPLKNNEFWSGISYRQDFGNDNDLQKSSFGSFILGYSIKQFIFTYSYMKQFNEITFSAYGFHQIGIGYNFDLKRQQHFWEL